MSAKAYRRARWPMSTLTFCQYGLTIASYLDFVPLWDVSTLGELQ